MTCQDCARQPNSSLCTACAIEAMEREAADDLKRSRQHGTDPSPILKYLDEHPPPREEVAYHYWDDPRQRRTHKHRLTQGIAPSGFDLARARDVRYSRGLLQEVSWSPLYRVGAFGMHLGKNCPAYTFCSYADQGRLVKDLWCLHVLVMN